MSLLIIGDSHVIRLRRSLSYDIPVKKCQWVSGKCDWEHVLQAGGVSDTVYFSAHRGRNAWTSKKVLEEINPCLKDIANEGVEVAAAFGYIDAKIQLVRYKDAKETVKKYVDGFLNFFPNNKVTFIEPLPQFINNLGTGPDIYDFKDRYPMHKEFVHYLNEYLFDNGLQKPISQEKILGTDKLDESFECHECDYCLMPESSGIKWDHLKYKYNKILSESILSNYSIFLTK